jgi:hypothetical protein
MLSGIWGSGQVSMSYCILTCQKKEFQSVMVQVVEFGLIVAEVVAVKLAGLVVEGVGKYAKAVKAQAEICSCPKRF